MREVSAEYDFSVRGQRFRGSTQETKSTKAAKVASLKLARAVDGLDPLPSKAVLLAEISRRFLEWLDDVRLEDKTKTYYRDGWRLLKATTITDMRLDQITGDTVERLKFSGSPSNANCALRTLRRMLHKADEWKLIQYAPKIKLMKEPGRCLRLDDEAEKKLLAAASECTWRKRSRELFRDIVILMRDTGMRNERELYRTRIENLDWENRLIFVPDSKTAEGRRLVPMSKRVFELLEQRCSSRSARAGSTTSARSYRSRPRPEDRRRLRGRASSARLHGQAARPRDASINPRNVSATRATASS